LRQGAAHPNGLPEGGGRSPREVRCPALSGRDDDRLPCRQGLLRHLLARCAGGHGQPLRPARDLDPLRLRRRRAAGAPDRHERRIRGVEGDLARPLPPGDHDLAPEAAGDHPCRRLRRPGRTASRRSARMDPKGKVALVTGGARIGRTVAAELARRGCDVALTYRGSRQSAEETAQEVEKLGARTLVVQADLATSRGPAAVVRAVGRKLGRLDILVCMASLYDRSPLRSLDEKVWEANLDSNLRSVYLLALGAAPIMKSQGAGRIVTFADWLPASGRPRYRSYLPYYVSKAGVVGL